MRNYYLHGFGIRDILKCDNYASHLTKSDRLLILTANNPNPATIMAAILLGSGNVRLTASTGGAHRISRMPIAVPAADIFSDRVVLAIAANSEVRSLCNNGTLKC
jgi:hypothetical protein